jgi:hypothetical protein
MLVRSAAKSNMTEISTQDRAKRRSSEAHAGVLVSGYELARHFGCSRQNVDLLAQQGVIERRSDGKFDQDVSRLKYLTHCGRSIEGHRGRRLMQSLPRPRRRCWASGSRRSSGPWCAVPMSMR